MSQQTFTMTAHMQKPLKDRFWLAIQILFKRTVTIEYIVHDLEAKK